MTSSIRLYRGYAVRFVQHCHAQHAGPTGLQQLDGAAVVNYIAAWADYTPSRNWGRTLCTCTRSFLRFLRWDGVITQDLAAVVPPICRYQLSTVPKHLAWEQVREVIDSVNTLSPVGMRDKAILLLVATLGLRNRDVRDLCFAHIDWRKGEFHLPKTKSQRARVLPITQEVGDAVADYVLHGRPAVDVPQVFLGHNAPIAPLSEGGLSAIVRRHLKRLGIVAPHFGTHLLRHSLATKLVNEATPIKDIADMLGHVSMDTTAIYTKVDTVHLAEVALPFP